MSTQRPDPAAAETAVELDPAALGEEHVIDDDLAAEPEEYEPQPELAEPTREASLADVAEQLTEVTGDEDDEVVALEDEEL
jgi:hypothetical protein